MTNSLFNAFDSTTEEAEINATIEALKTKYAKDDNVDIDGLLKKAAHAERHIKSLEKEAAERGSSDKVAAKLEEILAQIEAKKTAQGEQHNGSETPNSPASNVDLDKIVEQKLNAYETKKAYERNAQLVTEELVKMWGTDYVSKLRARAREIGESEEFLNQLAMTRPQTFLALVKETHSPSVDVVVPQGNRITTSSNKGLKTYADFEKLRKENPSSYKSKAVQDELFRLTAEYAAQGKSFTST